MQNGWVDEDGDWKMYGTPDNQEDVDEPEDWDSQSNREGVGADENYDFFDGPFFQEDGYVNPSASTRCPSSRASSNGSGSETGSEAEFEGSDSDYEL